MEARLFVKSQHRMDDRQVAELVVEQTLSLSGTQG